MALAEMVFPVVGPAVGTLVAGALGAGGGNGLGAAAPELDGQLAIANLEMRDPDFWQPPPPDLRKAVLACGVGMVLGMVMASRVFRG